MPRSIRYATVAPGVRDAMLALQKAVDGSALEPRLHELVCIRASQLNHCEYCVDVHARAARKGGESDARIDRVADWRSSELFSERERAALLWTEAVTCLSRERISAAEYGAVRACLDDAEIAWLTLALIAVNGWNRLNTKFREPPEAMETAG